MTGTGVDTETLRRLEQHLAAPSPASEADPLEINPARVEDADDALTRGAANRLRHIAIAALAAFTIAGQLKQIPPFSWSPVDATLLFGVTAFAAAALSLLMGQYPPRTGPMAAAAVFFLLVLAGTFAGAQGDYGELKATRLFTVTLVAVVATAMAMRSELDQFKLLRWLVWWCIYSSVAVLFLGEQVGGSEGRFQFEGGNSIGFARTASYVVVAVLVWLVNAKPLRPVPTAIALALGAAELWIMFAIASRGPIQGVIFGALTILVLVVLRQRFTTWLRVAILSMVGVVGVAAAWASIPRDSKLRILGFRTGDSVYSREAMWEWTARNLPWNAFGNGWGSWDVDQREFRKLLYPHNIVLELGYEAGLVGVAAFLLLVGAAMVVQFRRRGRRPALTMFALVAMVFWVAAAQVSGDVNDNRAIYVLAVASMAPMLEPALARLRRRRRGGALSLPDLR